MINRRFVFVAGALATALVLSVPAMSADRMVIAEEFTATW
jgi:hypothetical protein